MTQTNSQLNTSLKSFASQDPEMAQSITKLIQEHFFDPKEAKDDLNDLLKQSTLKDPSASLELKKIIHLMQEIYSGENQSKIYLSDAYF